MHEVRFGIAALAVVAVSACAHADSLNNFSDAVGDSGEASARVTAAGGQVAVGAVAVPLAAVGGLTEATGNAANVIANDLWDIANAPLEVDEDVVIAQPLPKPSVDQMKGEDQ